MICEWHVDSEVPEVTFPPGNLTFLCIGTDRCIGDSLGPIVGSSLQASGVRNVYGTLDNPVHALNLDRTYQEIKKNHPNTTIIAIDAVLGKLDNVGKLKFGNKSLAPGAGVGKDLIEVGDYSLIGIVGPSGLNGYSTLQNTRLSLVVEMANAIVYFILTSRACGAFREVI